MSKPVVLDTLPEVRLLEDITRESAARLIEQLAQYKGVRVALSIFSNGGDVHGSQAVAAYISNPANEMQVEARIYGNAASGAMIIAAACQTAYISAGSFALIHKARAVGPDGVIADADLPKEERAVLDAMNADQVELFKKRTGKTGAAIEKLMEQDRDMHAEEAAELGFFDGIIPQAMRLAAYKQIPAMAEDKPKTVAYKVTAGECLKAIASGEIHVPAEQVDAKITALEKELSELKASKELSDKAKTDAEAVTAAEVKAKEALETELKASKDAIAAYVAKVEALEKTPLKAQTLPDGTEVVIPGGEAEKKEQLSRAAQSVKASQDTMADYFARKQKATA